MSDPLNQSRTRVGMSLDSVMRECGVNQSVRTYQPNYALPLLEKLLSQPPGLEKLSRASEGWQNGDGSILDGWEEGVARRNRAVDTSFIAEVLTGTEHKLAMAHRDFWSFVLPNGVSLEQHRRETFVKSALMASLPPAQQQSQLAAQHQQMNSFIHQPPPMPQQAPIAPPLQTGPAGLPAAAPGHQTLTGVQQRPIGLDQPCDTRATPMPGTPGHAATNIIDQQGGLDPRGLTVDGNNAAGVRKFASHDRPTLDTTGGDNSPSKIPVTELHKDGTETTEEGAKYHQIDNRFYTREDLLAAGPKTQAERILALQKAGHGPKRCTACGNQQQCRCMREHHFGLELPVADMDPEDCYECRRKVNGDKSMSEILAGLSAQSKADVLGEKSAAVASFRPVNADPDFIRANKDWHDAERKRMADNANRHEDPCILSVWIGS